MSGHEHETTPGEVPDDALPEDLQPGDDNPLAEGLPEGETAEGLLTEGKDGDDPEEKAAEPEV